MKNRKPILKVLLDTTFLLPTLGIDTGEDVLKSLKKLADTKAEIYFSNFSILESLWTVARLSKKRSFNLERFKLGLRSILESRKYERVQESSEIFNDALRIYMLGHKDMIDNLLYASSIYLNLKLLTQDIELRDFLRKKALTDTLIFPDQII